METLPSDRTNYGQSLMHALKKNLGAGILAMPTTLAHCGLTKGVLGLPILCSLTVYCAHLLIKSSRQLENKMNWKKMDYAELAKGAFRVGPKWMQSCSKAMSAATDYILVISHLGSCCVYLVFVIDNLHNIISTYGSPDISKYYLFVAIFPIILWLSCIKTLRRLAIASTFANFLQVTGVLIILEHLIREAPNEWPHDHSKSISEMALGFGAAMFAFEGIGVVLPIYIRMKQPQLMDSCCGVINASYSILLVLYLAVGLLGYMKYGEQAKGSITLNLPKEPLYDIVRGIFTTSITLSYPLQLYVPAEIVTKWLRSKLPADNKTHHNRKYTYEYLCRTILVLITFALAMTVPRLNLIMNLVGSIAGTTISIILPAIIHLATFWNDATGCTRIGVMMSDSLIIVLGFIASGMGTYFSGLCIWETFGDPLRED